MLAQLEVLKSQRTHPIITSRSTSTTCKNSTELALIEEEPEQIGDHFRKNKVIISGNLSNMRVYLLVTNP